ncbi:MAG: metallophosphoesterase [Candidatus Bathyarchaeia archaeon]|jgi:hypothetical protein
MQVLAFSDLHGDASTLKLLKDSILSEEFDYMLVAGDLTNADLVSTSETIRQVNEVFSIMESFKIPYYYVWGLPNREQKLVSLIDIIENPDHYEVSEGAVSRVHRGMEEEEQAAFVFHRKSFEGNRTVFPTFIPKNDWESLKEMTRFVASLHYGRLLKEQERVKLGDYWLTSSEENLPEHAILLKHHYRKLTSKALIQLDGHLHFGQYVLNYLNLGFIYRDAVHGASPMVGCYWKLNLNGSNVNVSFKNLGGKLKEYNCPNHPQEGKFYIPIYWKKCPICYEPKEAIMR